MAVFISLETDSFAQNFNAANSAAQAARRAGTSSARRPLRGLEIKDDTFGILRVVQANGKPISLLDSGSSTGQTTDCTNFILQSVQEARMEKHQIVETFGEPYIFFFGESPRFLDVTAVLVDSNDFNWYAEFWQNYNNNFRGTRLVEQGARCYLFYDDNIVEGYMLNAQARKVSDQPLMAQLSFRLYLTNYSNLTVTGNAANPQFPVRASVSLPPDVSLTSADPSQVQSAAATNLAQISTAAANQAQVGAQQQAGGFGGGQNLASALASGYTSSTNPTVNALLANVNAATGNAGSRTLPLRGLIATNTDEWTGGAPTQVNVPTNDPTTNYQDQQADTAGQPDAIDLPSALEQQAGPYGVNPLAPTDYGNLGLLPTFSAQQGFGVGISAGITASFGVGGGASATFGAAGGTGMGSSYYGGINGGLGFTGSFTSIASASLVIQPPNVTTALTQANVGVAYNDGVYGNGVVIQGGVVQGTGVGGGIPGGLSGGVGPNGPGTLTQYTGGTSYSSSGGYSSSQGYGPGLSGTGASLNVGGSPSLFATSVVSGDLNATPSDEISLFIGPDGNQSSVNTTGLII